MRCGVVLVRESCVRRLLYVCVFVRMFVLAVEVLGTKVVVGKLLPAVVDAPLPPALPTALLTHPPHSAPA